MRTIQVLYEDQRGPRKGFGLHELLVNCVADRTGKDRHALGGRLAAIPLKGNAKLLERCKVAGAFGAPFVAVFDSDRVRRLLSLPPDATDAQVVGEIGTRSGRNEIAVALLDRNTETVVEAAAHCFGEPPPQKSIDARDKLLLRAAWNPDDGVRKCIEVRVPSFAALADGVARLCACE